MKTNWLQHNHSNKIKWFNYVLLALIFVVNFMGIPELKFFYAGYALFVLFCILFLDFSTSIHMIISFSFIEGQGRILWGYTPIVRIAFDGMIVLATVKNFVVKRNFKIGQLLPKFMLFLILLHFLWYLVEVFNLDSINIWAAIAGTKVYLFPFFLLIYLRQNEEVFSLDFLKGIGTLIFFLLIAESLLCLHQLKGLEGFMLEISPHYRNAIRGDIFTQDKFRPFGTTQLPGAVSVYIFLTFSLLFLRKEISKRMLLFVAPLSTILFIVLIVSQVRSALLKFVVIILGTLVAILINSKNRAALLFRLTIILALLSPLTIYYFYPMIERYTSTAIDLEAGLKRWRGFESLEDITSQRASSNLALEVVSEKLSTFPMGIGPAMTGAAGSLSVDLIKKDPVYTKDTFWGYDNFYLSMVIEFGYGAIFYLLFIVSIPLILMVQFYKLYRLGDLPHARVLAISLVVICVIIVGNWGAIGIPYNPESFFFWFWTAIGFNIYGRAMKEAKKDAQHL